MSVGFVGRSFAKHLFSKISLNMVIKAALIDLSGTLHVEDEPTADAVGALKRFLYNMQPYSDTYKQYLP